jgi:ferric-dicitrate binding protein FerR (iron transport regulator)
MGTQPQTLFVHARSEPGTSRQGRPGRLGDGDRRSVVWRIAGIAAGIAVIATGSLAVWHTGRPAPAQQFREFASAPGSRTTIVLRDGTRLALGPATHLRVPGDFGASSRTVELDGEVLFTVVHDARRPFQVRTRHTTVTDVGTTFAVRAYADDADEQIAVAEGEVALPGAALSARDVAAVDSAGRIRVRRGVDVSPYVGFAQGLLAFKDTPLSEAARDLARTFDLDVTIADSTLATKPVTASFTGQPVDEVLDVVSHVVGAHFERHGRAVVIRRGVAPVGRRGPATTAEQRMTDAAPLNRNTSE